MPPPDGAIMSAPQTPGPRLTAPAPPRRLPPSYHPPAPRQSYPNQPGSTARGQSRVARVVRAVGLPVARSADQSQRPSSSQRRGVRQSGVTSDWAAQGAVLPTGLTIAAHPPPAQSPAVAGVALARLLLPVAALAKLAAPPLLVGTGTRTQRLAVEADFRPVPFVTVFSRTSCQWPR